MNKSKQQPQTGTFSLDEVMEAVREDRQKDIDAGREYYPMNEVRTRAAAENTEAVTKITIINNNDSRSPTEEASPMEYSELLQAGIDEGILSEAVEERSDVSAVDRLEAGSPKGEEASAMIGHNGGPRLTSKDTIGATAHLTFPGDRQHELICDINGEFQKAALHADKVKRHRVRAGQLLIEASKYVPAGTWQEWCRSHIQRSLGDIRKCIKLASSVDPEAAAEDEKRRNAEAAQRARDNKRSDVSAVATNTPTLAELLSGRTPEQEESCAWTRRLQFIAVAATVEQKREIERMISEAFPDLAQRADAQNMTRPMLLAAA